jgi:hypothetical protein
VSAGVGYLLWLLSGEGHGEFFLLISKDCGTNPGICSPQELVDYDMFHRIYLVDQQHKLLSIWIPATAVASIIILSYVSIRRRIKNTHGKLRNDYSPTVDSEVLKLQDVMKALQTQVEKQILECRKAKDALKFLQAHSPPDSSGSAHENAKRDAPGNIMP